MPGMGWPLAGNRDLIHRIMGHRLLPFASTGVSATALDLLRPAMNGERAPARGEEHEPTMILIPVCVSLVIWLALAGIRRFQAPVRLEARSDQIATWPAVTAIIPARNEARSIWPVIRSHLQTDYPGAFRLILVDDHSTDGTAGFAREAAGSDRRLVIARPPALPAGWSGKLWALRHGLACVEGEPEFILFTDADIVHRKDTLRRLVAKAQTDDLVLVSLMARLDRSGFWGRLLIPAFVYFFMKLYPFRLANRADHRLAAAAGGCMLIRRDRLAAIGGVDSIRGSLIDDCHLAHGLKNTEPRKPIFLGLADNEVISLRNNRKLGTIWTMVARTAYAQLDHNPLMLVGTVLGMTILYLVPPLAVLGLPLHGHMTAALIGAAAWFVMTLTYWPTIRDAKLGPAAALSLPLAGLFYTVMTVDSARRHWLGKGGAWKGRIYPGGTAMTDPNKT